MLVRVLEVQHGDPGLVKVSVGQLCLQGRWYGTWPASNTSVDVEVDLDGIFRWNESLLPDDDQDPRVTGDLWPAVVEAIDEGLVVLRVGGGLISIEAEGLPVDGGPSIGSRIRIRPGPIALYPTGT
jgi:hypothetical protein